MYLSLSFNDFLTKKGIYLYTICSCVAHISLFFPNFLTYFFPVRGKGKGLSPQNFSTFLDKEKKRDLIL